MASEPRIFHLIQQAHTTLFRESDRALRERFGIGTAQQAILFLLMRQDGAPITTLAEQLKMGKSSISGLVDRMESAGLVRRAKCPTDARSLLVYLEDKGRLCARDSLPATRQLNSALLAPFDAAERATIERFLRHVAGNSAAIFDRHAAHETATPDNRTKEPPR